MVVLTSIIIVTPCDCQKLPDPQKATMRRTSFLSNAKLQLHSQTQVAMLAPKILHAKLLITLCKCGNQWNHINLHVRTYCIWYVINRMRIMLANRNGLRFTTALLHQQPTPSYDRPGAVSLTLGNALRSLMHIK